MESLFQGDPGKQEPSPLERIGPEIAHLKKKESTRYGPGNRRPVMPWLITLTILAVLWLWAMDPLYFSFYKYEAIHDYLYLYNYGAGPEATRLGNSGIFTAEEVYTLDHRQGAFQDDAVSIDAATKKSEAIIQYLQSVQALQQGKVEQLGPVDKLRFYIFVRPGISVPTHWTALDPSVSD